LFRLDLSRDAPSDLDNSISSSKFNSPDLRDRDRSKQDSHIDDDNRSLYLNHCNISINNDELQNTHEKQQHNLKLDLDIDNNKQKQKDKSNRNK
jgi:hypothetical protein